MSEALGGARECRAALSCRAPSHMHTPDCPYFNLARRSDD
jgi:hypothetical protein